MNKGKEILLQFAAIAALVLLPAASFAQVYGTRERQMGTLLNRIETRTDSFKRAVDTSLERTPMNSTAREDRITDFIADFETATTSLRSGYDGRRDVTNEVNDVLNRALFIDRFMTRNNLAPRAESDWMAIRTDLNTLSRLYAVSWDWNRMPDYRTGRYDNGPYNNPPYNPGPNNNGGYGTGRGGFDARMTGTYRLNRSLGDDVNGVLDRSGNAYSVAQRDRMRRNLERRLTSPDMMAIEKTGRTMTMASSLSPQVTIDVDGVARTETNDRGRTIRTTATGNRDSVEISYVGDRANEFYLTMAPTRDGQLRVTRRLYLENSNQTVSVSSVYDKINPIAQWSQVTTGAPWNAGNSFPSSGEFYIPNGTRLTAVLNNLVTSRATLPGDRFTMNVTSPSIYRDAVIEGRVANVDNSGRLSGRANVSLEFDNIRMPDGRSFQFAGVIDSVRALNGDSVSVTNEGSIRDDNQTTKTVTRAGVGAALGALIGAIAGGGKGAAIGAAVGAGAGAGSVLIQGRDNVELEQGTEFNITVTGPTNAGVIRR